MPVESSRSISQQYQAVLEVSRTMVPLVLGCLFHVLSPCPVPCPVSAG